MGMEYLDYGSFRMIEGEERICALFNGIMRSLGYMRRICSPMSFRREKGIADFQDEKFCSFCRDEVWMHETVRVLRKWKELSYRFFYVYGGSCEKYAEAARYEELEDFGVDGDCPLDDFSIIRHLYDDERGGICTETVPDSVNELCADIIAASRVDIVDILRKRTSKRVKCIKVDDDGEEHPYSQEEYELDMALKQVNAEDDAKRLKAVAGGIYAIVHILESCSRGEDDAVRIRFVWDASRALLDLDFTRLDEILIKATNGEGVQDCGIQE